MPRSHRSSRRDGDGSDSGGGGGGQLVRYDSRRDRDRGYAPDALMKLPDPAHHKVSRRYSDDDEDTYRSRHGDRRSRGGQGRDSRRYNHRTHEGFLALMGLLFCGMMGAAVAEHEGYCDGCSDWYHTCFGLYE